MLPSSKRQTAKTPVAGIIRQHASSLESILVYDYPHCLLLSAHLEMEQVILWEQLSTNNGIFSRNWVFIIPPSPTAKKTNQTKTTKMYLSFNFLKLTQASRPPLENRTILF